MSKKKKKKQTTQEDYGQSDLMQKLGFTDEDAFFEAIYENSKALDSKPIGYESEDDAYSVEHGDEGTLDLLFISETEKYLLKISEPAINGYIWDDYFSWEVYDTYEEAKRRFDEFPYRVMHPKDAIKTLKEKINRDNIWIDVKSSGFGYYLNVKYDNCLIVEKGGADSWQLAVEQADRLDALQREWGEKGIRLIESYKRKEFPGNQRYYVFSFYANGKDFTYEAHIPKKMQNTRNRTPLDFISSEWIDEMAEGKEKYDAEVKEWNEAQEIFLKPLEEYEKTHDVSKPPFNYEKACELFDYLDKQMKFYLDPPSVSGCDGTLSKTDKWIKDNGFSEDERCHILCYLRNHHGFCDCEVLMNASEKEYWR